MSSIRRKILFPAMLVFFLFAAIVIFAGVRIYDHYYGMHRVKASTYTPELAADNEYNIVYGADYWGKAVRINDQLYLNMHFINETWADELFFYAEDVGIVYYTTQSEQREFPIGSTENGETPDYILYEDEPYMMAESLMLMLGTQYYVNEEDSLVMVRRIKGMAGNVEKFRTYVTLTPDPEEQQYTVELNRNDLVEVFEYNEETGYSYVETTGGYMGYVPNDRLTVHEDELSLNAQIPWHTDTDLLPPPILSMGFVQKMDSSFTQDDKDLLLNTWDYLNCVAPTWFSLNTIPLEERPIGSKGDLVSIANPDYVKWCKYNEWSVIAVVTNSFDDDVTYEVLSSTARRKALCSALLTACEENNLNGINIDFENISEETYPYFIQFLRELSITLRPAQYLLSIDCPPPSEWTDYYRRDIYNDLCDYIIVMAYDEYWDGSDVAGPVSSKNFTLNAIYDCLKEGVQKDRLVLGIPWYTRVWEGDDGDLIDTYACGMNYAEEMVMEYDLYVGPDPNSGMNLAEGYDEDGDYIRIWLEDEVSQEWRLNMALDSGLGGIATWRVGLQNSDIWDIYEELMPEEPEEY